MPFFDADIFDMEGLIRLGATSLGLSPAPGGVPCRPMDPLHTPEALAYAESHSTAPPPHLAAVDESTRKDFPAWGMMVGRQEGRFLEMLVFAAQATRVLEIGTFTGYSSIAMAAGLPEGGSIISLEVDPHHATIARGNIAAAGLESRISVIEGPALDIAGRAERALRPGVHRRRQGGLRRLLRGGAAHAGAARADRGRQHPAERRRARQRRARNEAAAAIAAFNDKLVNDPRVVCVLTTIRDGVTLIRRAG